MARVSHKTIMEIAKDQQTQAEKDQGLTVRKANQLIQKNRFDMSVREQRLLLYCISRIKPTDRGGELYKIKIQDVYRASGIDGSDGRAYEAMKEAVKRLDSFNFELKDENGAIDIVHWIRDTKIDKGRGVIAFRFDPRVTPYLFNVRKYFTQYELGNALRMKSVYSVRLYEIVKSYENIREKGFTLDELRYLLGADIKTVKIEPGVYVTRKNTSYEQYARLKQKVIDPAVKEINECTDLEVSYAEVKKGRKVVGLRFVITDASDKRSEKQWEEIDRQRHPERYKTV